MVMITGPPLLLVLKALIDPVGSFPTTQTQVEVATIVIFTVEYLLRMLTVHAVPQR